MEQTLARYYRSGLSKSAWVLALLGIATNFLTGIAVKSFGSDNLFANTLPFLASFGVITALFLVAERQIRTRLWKLAYPEFDLDGTWIGATKYERRYLDSQVGQTGSFTPFSSPNSVCFTQDCLNIVVRPSQSPAGTGNWRSLVAGLTEGPTVQYAYLVDYAGAQGFPHEAIGYEKLSVVEPSEGVRPTRLSGSFSHCMRGQTPVFSGSVAFTRAETRERSSWFVTAIARFAKPKEG